MLTSAVYGRNRFAAAAGRLVVAAGIAGVGLWGCASRIASVDEAGTDAAMVVAPEPDAPLAAEPLEDASVRVEAGPIEFVPRGADGAVLNERAGRLVITQEGVPEDDTPGTWTLRRGLIGDDGQTRITRIQHVQRLDDGSVVLLSEQNIAEDVEVVFEPAMVVMPPRDTPLGEDVTQTFTMTVYVLGNRDRVKASGEATNIIRRIGDQRFRLSDGRQQAAVQMIAVLHARLSPADVRNVTAQWFGPLDEGDTAAGRVRLLGERREERTTVLGIPSRHSIERWVRVTDEK